ncbi:hypothetical protein HBI12_207930 [Parastagonospora nodorum]|nr:hypothetical protein HBH72_235290 [Parastagonospora nodorum]KAH5297331.1 hypothetical protein HBI12_207930 [Parastagonospora nodorum]KAH5390857.1 hypothetical protein HBI32_240730 [Parastagonospora nodorum]KAH5546038.1 hypothetical protein HBI27_046680 [Parastagonospora nodorum]
MLGLDLFIAEYLLAPTLMRQPLAFTNKRMRIAYTNAGNDVWIAYFRVHTGQDTRDNPEYTERGNIDFKTFVEELNINGVKD